MTEELNSVIEKSNSAMPAEIRIYLNQRGITDESITYYKLGYLENYNGFNWITIPIKDLTGKYYNVRLRKDPRLQADGDKFQWYLTGTESTLFNLEALADNNDGIFICEGEMDAIILSQLGVPCICSTAGAGTFKNEWLSLFKNLKQIFICLDNDQAGKQGTEMIINKLLEFTEAKILTINLPEEVGDGGDITDYFTKLTPSNPEKYNIDALLDSAQEYRLPGLLTADDLINYEFNPAERWIIKDFLPSSGNALFAGQPGSYKSWLCMEIARCVSNGEDFLGQFKTLQGNVLLADEENSPVLLKERMKSLGISGNNILAYSYQGIKIMDTDWLNKLKITIKRHNVKLTIFDTLIRIHNFDENASMGMSQLYECFKQINKLGCAIILIHHTKKAQPFGGGYQFRGSSEIIGQVNSAFSITRINNDTIKIHNEKMRECAMLEDFGLKFTLIEGKAKFEIIDKKAYQQLKLDNEINELAELFKDQDKGLTIDEIKALLPDNIGDTKLRKTLTFMVATELLNEDAGAHNKKTYKLKEPKPVS